MGHFLALRHVVVVRQRPAGAVVGRVLSEKKRSGGADLSFLCHPALLFWGIHFCRCSVEKLSVIAMESSGEAGRGGSNNTVFRQKCMLILGNAGWQRKECRACTVLLSSDRTPGTCFRHTFLPVRYSHGGSIGGFPRLFAAPAARPDGVFAKKCDNFR